MRWFVVLAVCAAACQGSKPAPPPAPAHPLDRGLEVAFDGKLPQLPARGPDGMVATLVLNPAQPVGTSALRLTLPGSASSGSLMIVGTADQRKWTEPPSVEMVGVLRERANTIRARIATFHPLEVLLRKTRPPLTKVFSASVLEITKLGDGSLAIELQRQDTTSVHDVVRTIDSASCTYTPSHVTLYGDSEVVVVAVDYVGAPPSCAPVPPSYRTLSFK